MNEGYTPPSLEQSGSLSIAGLRNRHRGQTCYIVGKGPSLQYLRWHHVGPGFVITINEAVVHVQTLGLPNQIYAMQKDGCATEDQTTIARPCGSCHEHGWKRAPVIDPLPGITALFSQYISSWCLHGRPNRYVFTDEELGFAGFPFTMSTLEAIPLALYLGAEQIVMVSFDSLVNGDNGYVREHFLDDAALQVAQSNLDWARPRVLAMLARLPHSFLVPQP